MAQLFQLYSEASYSVPLRSYFSSLKGDYLSSNKVASTVEPEESGKPKIIRLSLRLSPSRYSSTISAALTLVEIVAE